MAGFDHFLEFKITLRDIKPAIWRRIQVPHTYTFWDFHVAIQDAMGWDDMHLHGFDVKEPISGHEIDVGIPGEEWDAETKTLPGWLVPVALFFTVLNRKGVYTYDYGDDWRHNILLEKIAPIEKGASYPRCVAGKRACPPEDSGGPGGYATMLEAIQDPKHPEHETYLEWLGGPFDPKDFHPAQVVFDDPNVRWAMSFGDEPEADEE
jgi:hypothetical protein